MLTAGICAAGIMSKRHTHNIIIGVGIAEAYNTPAATRYTINVSIPSFMRWPIQPFPKRITVAQASSTILSTPYFLFAARCTAAGATLTGAAATNYKTLLDGLVADGLFNVGGGSNYLDALYVLAAPSSTVALL